MNTCVECGPTDRRIHGHGKCVNCYHREYQRAWRNQHARADAHLPRLPLEPLAEFFERNGHLVDAYRRDEIRGILDNADRRGVLLHMADRILVNDFGIHPTEVYGQAWWAA